MSYSDFPEVDHAVEVLLYVGFGPDPFRCLLSEEPSLMTIEDVIEAVRREFGERAASSVKITLH